jgi:hypothetical protein
LFAGFCVACSNDIVQLLAGSVSGFVARMSVSGDLA